MIPWTSEPEVFAPWLAPYLLGLVLVTFLIFLFRFFQNWYSLTYNRPLFRDLWIYKKLTSDQLEVLQEKLPYYKNFSDKNKKRFEHRVCVFLSKKKFIGRENIDFTDDLKLLIAGYACMLSLGRKNYLFNLVEVIILFPDGFSGEMNAGMRYSEFNPKQKAVVFSQSVLANELNDPENTTKNSVLFEFMHAMQVEARIRKDMDAQRFNANYQEILHYLLEPGIKSDLESTLLKEFPFSNEFEFMAALAVCFFKQPERFQTDFPELFEYLKKLLGYYF